MTPPTMHLDDIYLDGQHYDAKSNIIEDLPFWYEMYERFGSPVLELACGTGRITIPLKQKGAEITGIDLSETMLRHASDKCKKAGLHIDLIHGNISDFDLGQKFKLIFLPFNSICHLYSYEQIKGCFDCVRNHLAVDGRFVVDVFNPSLKLLTVDPGEVMRRESYTNPYDGSEVQLTEKRNYDSATQINHITWDYNMEGTKKTNLLNMRMFYPQELDNYLRFCGFEIEHKYGDFSFGKFTPDSQKQLIVCKAN